MKTAVSENVKFVACKECRRIYEMNEEAQKAKAVRCPYCLCKRKRDEDKEGTK